MPEDDEGSVDQGGEVTIDLDEQAKPESDDKGEPEYVKLEDLDKLQKQINGLSYLGRKLDEVTKKMDSYQGQGSERPVLNEQKVETVKSDDPWDQMLDKDWKGAVRGLAKEEIATQVRYEKEQAWKSQAEQERVTVLEASKKEVRDKYPDIDNPDSPIAKRYYKIINDHPEYIRNEHGPKLAMRDMEDELKSQGNLDDVTKEQVDKEVIRRTRADGASVKTNSSKPGSGNKVTLTRDQKEFCDHNEIKYENYAKMLGKASKQGVETS